MGWRVDHPLFGEGWPSGWGRDLGRRVREVDLEGEKGGGWLPGGAVRRAAGGRAGTWRTPWRAGWRQGGVAGKE